MILATLSQTCIPTFNSPQPADQGVHTQTIDLVYFPPHEKPCGAPDGYPLFAISNYTSAVEAVCVLLMSHEICNIKVCLIQSFVQLTSVVFPTPQPRQLQGRVTSLFDSYTDVIMYFRTYVDMSATVRTCTLYVRYIRRMFVQSQIKHSEFLIYDKLSNLAC